MEYVRIIKTPVLESILHEVWYDVTDVSGYVTIDGSNLPNHASFNCQIGNQISTLHWVNHPRIFCIMYHILHQHLNHLHH